MSFLGNLLEALFGGGAGGWSAERSEGRARPRVTARHNVEQLAALGLPNLQSPEELAAALGINVPTLHWLTRPDDGDEPLHYIAFAVPKRSGGYRVIYAPKTRLKAAQRWVHREILDKVQTRPEAHGFVRERSIFTNAAAHARAAMVIKVDLEDFFPSITYRRVRGLFQALGYGQEVAVPLALLCTVKPAPKVVEFLGGIKHRMLPQGAPTSPAIANLVCRRLDARLGGLAARFGCAYTRYADDITFSGDEAFERSLKRFLPLLWRIIKGENFRLNKKKMHFARRGARQTVTGLTVNDGPAVPRRYRRQLRAILHNAANTGLDAQNRSGHPNFAEHLRGRIEFVRATHPDLAERLLGQLSSLH